MRNPFTIGIVQGGDLCDRQNETADLIRHAKNGQSVVLYAPRRYGKSSLVIQALMELDAQGVLTAYADLFPVSSEQDFISRFATSVLQGIGKGADPQSFWEKAADLFVRLIPSIEVTPDGLSVSVTFDRHAKTELLLEDLMEGLYKYLKKKRLRACIALDEFQEITQLKSSKRIEGILRSHMQRHREVAYLYIGSRRRILQDMFTNKNRPFYKSAFLYTLNEIPKKEFVPYIVKKFSKSKKTCPRDAAERIYELARGYPYYVQKLSSLAWDVTKGTCSLDTVQTAYALLLQMETPDFEGVWSGLTLVQKGVLKAMAVEPTASPYAKEYLERHGLSIGGAQKAISVLLERDLIEKNTEKRYRLTDPIMGVWLSGTGAVHV